MAIQIALMAQRAKRKVRHSKKLVKGTAGTTRDNSK